MTESEEELKNLLMRVEEQSEKAGLKHNIRKANIMVSDPIISRQIERKKPQQILFSWATKSWWMMSTARKLKDTCSLERKLGQTYTVH